MPVNTTHADYLGSEYEKMRDAFEGQRTIKAKTTNYLPKTGGMLEQEKSDAPAAAAAYSSYVQRSLFTGLVAPAVFGLTGLAHRVPWEIEMPEKMDYLREEATKSGITLDALIESITPEILLTGHYGMMADPDEEGIPRIVSYEAESIINWREADRRPTMIVLKETERVPLLGDRFATKEEDVYLVLELVDGRYMVEKHVKLLDSSTYGVIDSQVPSLQKGYIPFFIAGSQSTGLSPDKIPLSDMVEHLLRAYQCSADLGQILHMVASPTYHAYGVEEGQGPKVFGPDVVITYPLPTTKAEYVEISGNGIQQLREEIAEQLTLAKSSTHELAETGSSVESGEALATRVANKTATLRSAIINSANALELVLKSCATMQGFDPDEVSVTPNLSFTQEQADATIMTAFNNAIAANNVPKQLLWKYMRDSDLIVDIEDEELEEMLDKQIEDGESRAMNMMQGEAEIGAGILAVTEDEDDGDS